LLNRELVIGVKLCLVSVFLDIAKDCPKIRNLPKIFLRNFENVAHYVYTKNTYVVEYQLYSQGSNVIRSTVG